MKKKPKHLDFISWINRDGSGTVPVPEDMLECMLQNDLTKNKKLKLTRLSISQGTFIAIGFNSFVVKIKK
jgi:hypothetical protein